MHSNLNQGKPSVVNLTVITAQGMHCNLNQGKPSVVNLTIIPTPGTTQQPQPG